MTKKLLLPLAALVLLSFSLAQSQGTGTVSGVVRDTAGTALANVKIECYLEYQKVATLSSDSQGNFLARDLIPGKYLIHASLEGFELWKRDQVDVKAGRTAVLNIRLKPGTLVPETVVAKLQPGV
ncbi:MAG: carboxypeptidase regulatory-like domain-containing protein, partial [Candidatus Cloacimonetes bacterium]|nr:carboxypeptidase regulatory-like domain-containing protein [Candidatus Cloacimonadota bacterium]